MNSLHDLYREVGSALHKAQLVEYNIVSIHLLLIRTGSVESTKERVDSYWTRKTLGQILDPVLNSKLLPDDFSRFLDTVVKARNYLAHSFFVSAAEVHTTEGIAELMREVFAMQEVFARAHHFFLQLLSELARTQDINVEEIMAQAHAEVTASA